MANEFKVKNGIKFSDDTIQTSAGLPLTGGNLTGNVTTTGTIAINHVVGSTPGLDINHLGTQIYGLRVGDQTTLTNNTGIYLRTSSAATIAWGASGKLVFATSGGSVTRFSIGALGQLGIGASESFGTVGQVLTSGGPSAAPTWTTVSGGGSSAITISDTAPGSPTAGMAWWDSTVGSLRIYYNDGDTSQWVDAFNAQGNAGIAGTNGSTILNGTVDPTTQGVDGDFYINTTTKYFFGPKAAGTWPAGTYMLGTTLVAMGIAPPTTPVSGSTWWDSSIGKLFVYYNDGTSSQWVGVANDPGVDGIGVPVGGTIGQALIKNSATDYDTAWTSIIPSSGSVNISAGKFNTTLIAPTNLNRLNYEGNFYATNLIGALADSNIVYGSKTANTVLAAPDGSSGTPTFRTLTLLDLPDAWVKKAVKVATTANITLSGTQTIDGIALVAGDRVLVKNQTTTSANGIYTVSASTWTRTADANTSSYMSGAQVAVDQGTVNGGKTFDTDFKSTDTLGTTAMTWNRIVDDSILPLYYRKNTATTLTSGTTAQSWLGLTSGVTVAANTVYEFEGTFRLTTTGTTSHTESILFGLTTATVTNMDYSVTRFTNSSTATASQTVRGIAATAVVVTGAITTAQDATFTIRGTVAFGTGGSFNPQVQFSAAPGGTSTVILGAFFTMRAVGTTGSNSSYGTWA